MQPEPAMSLIAIILALALIGLVLWLINAYVPMDAKIKRILNIIVLVVVILWLLKVFGLWGHLHSIRV